MSLAELRDLFIVIFSVSGIVAIVCFLVIAFLTFRRVSSMLASGQATLDNIRNSTTMMSESIIGPLANIASVLQGVAKALEFLSGPMRKRGTRRSGRGEQGQ
ncbi:MAG: hypothetical protein SV910_07200 [Chloroflexota bacterium]|nr:hypothetical protein [Chloroflexota bacterium]